LVNYQSKTVVEILIVLFVVLSAASILALSMPTNSTLNAPQVLSVAFMFSAVAVAVSVLVPEFKGAPWVPTSRKLVSKVLKMEDIKPGEIVYDLGSGDGRLVIAAAKEFNARAVGIEIDPFRVFYSRFKVSRLGLGDKVKIVRGDFFKFDLREADVVVMYLLQQTNDRLQSKLEKELKPTCRVASVVWKFKGWDLIQADEDDMIYVYYPRPEELK